MPNHDLTLNQVAAILDVTPRTIRNYIMRGQLVAYQLPGGIRVRPEDLDAFRDARIIKPKAAA